MSNNKPFVVLIIISGIFSLGLGAFNFSFVLLKASELGIDNDVIPIVYILSLTLAILQLVFQQAF
jgi:hypothetical protein